MMLQSRYRCRLFAFALLMAAGLPLAHGQLVPPGKSQLPGQAYSRANSAATAVAPSSSAPLIAYRRDNLPQTTSPAIDNSPVHGTLPQQPARQPVRIDPAVGPAAHVDSPSVTTSANVAPLTEKAGGQVIAWQADSAEPKATVAEEDSRRLRRPTNSNTGSHGLANPEDAGRIKSPQLFPEMDMLRTAGTGLAVVVGLFLVFTWLFRRSGPKPTSPLPKEVVSVLGRAQLNPKQFVQLLQVGRKLVLISVTPDGTTPITEVTDPVEVDRLLGLCMKNHTSSTTAEFQQVLDQLSREHTKGFLGRETAAPLGAATSAPFSPRPT